MLKFRFYFYLKKRKKLCNFSPGKFLSVCLIFTPVSHEMDPAWGGENDTVPRISYEKRDFFPRNDDDVYSSATETAFKAHEVFPGARRALTQFYRITYRSRRSLFDPPFAPVICHDVCERNMTIGKPRFAISGSRAPFAYYNGY